MAVVTITLTDKKDDAGNVVNVVLKSDPPIPDEEEGTTPAQDLAMIAMSMLADETGVANGDEQIVEFNVLATEKEG